MKTQKIKKQFPIFKQYKNLRYLDNAATTQTPQVVIDAITQYYTQRRASVHRGTYQLSGLATQSYEAVRDIVANSINAHDKEIVFTSGATHGLNLLAQSVCANFSEKDNVVLTRMEHHANVVPWMQMSKRYGFKIRYIELTDACELDMMSAKNLIDQRTKIVSFAHMSNALGTINPVKELVSIAHAQGAIAIVDGAQAIAHIPIDVKNLDCDAYVYSAHKMYGPTGVGVLYAKEALLEKMEPVLFGGDMIKSVTYEEASWNDVPWKFEAGTPNIAGVIALGAATMFLQHQFESGGIQEENMLAKDARARLAAIKGVGIIGPQNNVGPLISFTIAGVHPHDVSTILGGFNVAVRAGHHCAMPLMQHLGISGTTRASFGVFNSMKDVEALLEGVQNVISRFANV